MKFGKKRRWDLILFLATTSAEMSVVSDSACCHPQPLKVVTQVAHDPCLKDPPPTPAAIPAPYFCEDGKPCPKCVPGEVCFEVADANSLSSNVEAVQLWVQVAWEKCRGAPSP